jgi:hypothetical protein
MQFRYTPRKNPLKDVLTGILAALVVLAALMASHPKVDTTHAYTATSQTPPPVSPSSPQSERQIQ